MASAGHNDPNDWSGGPTRFWSLDVVKSMPYVVWKPHRSQRDLLSRLFFDQGVFWKHNWACYFFWAQEVNPNKALILLPEDQVLDFIGGIQSALPNVVLHVPHEKDWPGLVADFAAFPETSPRFLGAPSDAESFTELKTEATKDYSSLTSRFGTTYVTRLESMVRQASNCLDNAQKKKKNAARKEADAVATAAFIELQKNLGLRSPVDNDLKNISILAVNRPLPFKPAEPPIFIAIDVEWDELNKSAITEVGICTIDTLDIMKVAPGHLGTNWRKHIRARHLRVEEHLHVTNTRFARGCPENFEFGKSEIYKRNQMAAVMASCFKPPYSWRGRGSRHPANTQQHRPIILVGHDPRADIDAFIRLGFDPTKIVALRMIQDTAQIDQFLTKSPQKRSLAAVLQELEIDAWNLHNAGNDAWYTLAACMGLAIAHRQGKILARPSPPACSNQAAAPQPAAKSRAEDLLIDL